MSRNHTLKLYIFIEYELCISLKKKDTVFLKIGIDNQQDSDVFQ